MLPQRGLIQEIPTNQMWLIDRMHALNYQACDEGKAHLSKQMQKPTYN